MEAEEGGDELVATLQRIADAGLCRESKKLATGAVFAMSGMQNQEAIEAVDGETGHVMLSYNW